MGRTLDAIVDIATEKGYAGDKPNSIAGAIDALGTVMVDYELPAATATTLGGIKVGEGLSVESDGTLSASGGAGMIITATGGDDTLTTDVTYEDAVAYVNAGNYDVVVIHDHSMSGYSNCAYRLGSFGMTYDQSAGSMVTVLEFYYVSVTTQSNKTELFAQVISMAPSGTTLKTARGTLGS